MLSLAWGPAELYNYVIGSIIIVLDFARNPSIEETSDV